MLKFTSKSPKLRLYLSVYFEDKYVTTHTTVLNNRSIYTNYIIPIITTIDLMSNLCQH